MNKVALVGNLTADPEYKELQEDRKVCKLRIALNGFKKDEVVYVDIDAWGKLASVCNEYLTKGSKVAVDGRLAFNQWETKEGEKRQKLFVVADQIDFMFPKDGSKTSSRPQPKQEVEEDDDVPF